MALERDIHELLYDHDCVIVPGFGGFLTHYRPARLDEQRRMVHPPSKELSFNRNLTRHDGLLADHLARREGMGFPAANQAIAQVTAEWNAMLEQHRRVELPRIGTFFHDAELNLQFEPDRRVNFLKDAFGLRPVAAIPVTRKPVPSVPVEQAQPADGMPPEDHPRTRGRQAAAAGAAVLCTAATWWSIGTGSGERALWSSYDLLPGIRGQDYVMPAAPETTALAPLTEAAWAPPEGLNGVHAFPIAGDHAPLVAVDMGGAQSVKAEPESTAVAVPETKARYFVVGGCFLEKENADRFISDLRAKGFAALLIDKKGGLYRVAYGAYPLRSTALEALEAVKREMAPDAWMLVK